MSAVLGVLALPLLVLTAHDLLRRPTIRRLALRNVVRRRGEAVLVVAGSMLATAIITASFILGDTLRSSIRDFARTELGPIDEIASVREPSRLPQLEAALADPVPGTDGTLPMVTAAAAVATPGSSPRSEPRATLVEVDFDAARRFGGDPATTGMQAAGPTPELGEAVIGEALADVLDVAPGDAVEVFAYGSRRSIRVRQVLPELGLAGFANPAAFVAPGTIASLTADAAAEGAAPPQAMVLVSNRGGVFGAAGGSLAVRDRLEARTAGVPGVEIRTAKRDLLADADASATEFIELFGGIGAFSVIAGILLLVNIFVMLADERQAELGILRAVGLKRHQLVRSFGMEGTVYAAVAALVGALVGIGVGRIVVVVAERVINAGQDDRFHLALRFTAEASSLLGGMVIGGVIALATVWAASLRISRLNVIRAIRDIPETVSPGSGGRRLALGVVGVVTGGLLTATGLASEGWFGALAGPPLVALGSAPVLARFLPSRLVVSVAGAFTLFWAVACFNLLPGTFEGASIPTFVVQGVILVAAAVTLGATYADATGRLVVRLARARGAVAARLAFAYPVARRFRTSMLLGMYALIIFVVTFLSVFGQLFRSQLPRFIDEARAGYDLVVESNRANPVPAERLAAQPEVESVAPVVRAYPEFTTPLHPERGRSAMTGFGDAYLARGVPELSDRQAAFATDEEAWRAVLADPGLVVVAGAFPGEDDGPGTVRLRPGDAVTVHHPSTGEQRQLTVAGLLPTDWLYHGAMVGEAFARQFMGQEAVASRHFVALRPGTDAAPAAAALNGRLAENGVDAQSIAGVIGRELQQQEGFMRLLQGYLALGLLVGIAGLGVVMVRAVRERRQQIGTLRAIGFPRRLVRRVFLLESGFIALQGILFGVVLALVTSYQLLTNSDTFGDQDVDFVVPWAALAVMLVATLAASLAAAAAPAARAARIRPAVALRIAD